MEMFDKLNDISIYIHCVYSKLILSLHVWQLYLCDSVFIYPCVQYRINVNNSHIFYPKTLVQNTPSQIIKAYII